MSLQDFIRDNRKKRGLTRSQLADRSGVTERTIINVESNQFGTTVATAELLCKALGVEYVLGGKGN